MCLHDTCYADCPEFFPEDEVKWFLGIYRRIAKKAAVILTVSEFSKKRIEEVLGVYADRIVMRSSLWRAGSLTG